MSDPSLALQGALVATLRAAATEAGANVYDEVPTSNLFPRITLGDGQSIRDTNGCYEGSEVFLDINVWTRSAGYPQTKRIASGIRDALDEAELVLDGHRLNFLRFENAVFSRDPDGLTRRARISLRALTQPEDAST